MRAFLMVWTIGVGLACRDAPRPAELPVAAPPPPAPPPPTVVARATEPAPLRLVTHLVDGQLVIEELPFTSPIVVAAIASVPAPLVVVSADDACALARGEMTGLVEQATKGAQPAAALQAADAVLRRAGACRMDRARSRSDGRATLLAGFSDFGQNTR